VAGFVAQGNSLHIPLKDESVDCVITSPPYFSVRDYPVKPVMWGGDPDCTHVCVPSRQPRKGGKNTPNNPPKVRANIREQRQSTRRGASSYSCTKCGAWFGHLGHEPNPELYTGHLCSVFNEVRRVLKRQGTLWVNIGDGHWSAKGSCFNPGGGSKSWQSWNERKIEGAYPLHRGNRSDFPWLGAKSLYLVPFRFALGMQGFAVISAMELLQLADCLAEAREKRDWSTVELVERTLRAKAFIDSFMQGWILRNVIIWHKPNCLPSSARDRFTVDFEYVFFFVKSNSAQYWTNEKSLELVRGKPAGTKGEEGRDWEWRKCPACSDPSYFNYRTRDALRKEEGSPQFKISERERKELRIRKCPRCHGTGKVKVNLWSGHDYYFDQQFEALAESTMADSRNQTGRHTQGHVRGSKYNDVDGQRKPSWYRSKVFVNSQVGRHMRCVWKIPTRGCADAHFATFPEELCEIPIKAGCPEQVCTECGMGRHKPYKRAVTFHSGSGRAGRIPEGKWKGGEQEVSGNYDIRMGSVVERWQTGATDCGCGAGWKPGIVLDPFCGSGSTGLACERLGRRFVGLDLSAEYLKMCQKRMAQGVLA